MAAVPRQKASEVSAPGSRCASLGCDSACFFDDDWSDQKIYDDVLSWGAPCVLSALADSPGVTPATRTTWNASHSARSGRVPMRLAWNPAMPAVSRTSSPSVYQTPFRRHEMRCLP